MKAVVKSASRFLAHVLVFPARTAYRVFGGSAGSDRLFQEFSQAFALVPGVVGGYLRAALYGGICTDVAGDASIGFLTVLSHADTTIGAGVYIGAQGNIGRCCIGAQCLLGSGVHVLSGKHQHEYSDPSVPMKAQGGRFEKIVIGADSWIGNQAVVMADIGTRSVVAAGAVVTRPVADYTIVAGNPARVVGTTRTDP